MAKKTTSPQDPFYQREAKKYDNPIPSREYILECLEQAGGPLKFKAIQHTLELYDIEQEVALTRRLRAMERDGQLHCDRRGAYGIVNKLDLASGVIQGHRDGFGFFLPDAEGPDWFVSAKEMRKVFPGERVLVREKRRHSDGRIEAGIVEVLQSDEPLQIVGRYYQENGINFVSPEDPRIAQDILIPPDDPLNVENGQVVVVHLVTRPTYRSKAIGRVAQVLGDYLAPGMEIEIAIAQYGIRNHWDPEIHDQLQQLPLEVEEKDLAERKDLRHLPLITIDGEDARDFDDAVYCQPVPTGGWKLWVAIADVSHYVQIDSSLDIEAQKRGNSVYFPNSVVPMLPEQVSNGLCSLKPNVDRLCMICEMSINAKGVVTANQFYPAVMHSKARMTYTKVWDILQGDKVLVKEHADLVEPIKSLHLLYQARHRLKAKRGAIDFETTETQIIFNEQRKIEKIIPVIRNDAHKIIEECMICANVAAAQFFIKNKVAGLYRVHLGPTDIKLEKLRSYLAGLGLSIPITEKPTPQIFQQLLDAVKDRTDVENIQIMLLRSMSQAEYSPENEGHFGLAFESYTHFTSPIRRYPDLIVHRIIKALVSDKKSQSTKQNSIFLKLYTKEKLASIGQANSLTERNADLATRDVNDWLKCEYMQSHIGNRYFGKISSVANFGVFVRLNDVFVDGLVHVTELGDDYFHFDAARQSMVGERTRQVFTIGDELEIEVAQVDIEQRKIDFSLVALLSSNGKPIKKMTEREKLYAGAKRKVKQAVETEPKKTFKKKKFENKSKAKKGKVKSIKKKQSKRSAKSKTKK